MAEVVRTPEPDKEVHQAAVKKIQDEIEEKQNRMVSQSGCLVVSVSLRARARVCVCVCVCVRACDGGVCDKLGCLMAVQTGLSGGIRACSIR